MIPESNNSPQLNGCFSLAVFLDEVNECVFVIALNNDNSRSRSSRGAI